MDTFNFCPNSNVPETLPREASATTMSLNGWQFSARPTTPYQRKIKLTLHGLRWFTDPISGLYDYTSSPTINAHALERFYEDHETWSPFIINHQHFGPMTVRFATPLVIPAGETNSGGFIKPVEVMLVQHNPAYGHIETNTSNVSNTYSNTTLIGSGNGNFRPGIQYIEDQLNDLEANSSTPSNTYSNSTLVLAGNPNFRVNFEFIEDGLDGKGA